MLPAQNAKFGEEVVSCPGCGYLCERQFWHIFTGEKWASCPKCHKSLPIAKFWQLPSGVVAYFQKPETPKPAKIPISCPCSTCEIADCDRAKDEGRCGLERQRDRR